MSTRFVAPRMLAVDEYDGVHHTDVFEHEKPEDANSYHDYDRQLSGAEAYQLEYDVSGQYTFYFTVDAYTGGDNAPNSYSHISQKRPVHRSATALVPVSTLPDWCRGMFKFGLFNAMQSQCFTTAMDTNSNMVISAPTGAGKTVLFELAMIKLLQSTKDTSNYAYKCVYMAPTKAICSERHRDWSEKFSHIGVKCVELTGDTMATGRQAWKEAKDSTVIITTPEKWDSLTRNWHDSVNFLQQIKLFMVDEVHTVSETTRGSCLEVVVSRMMQRGNSVRFVLLSATAPNIEDLKDWLSSCSSGETTAMFKFGDEFRPCKLKRYVYGFPRPQGHNDFQFMKALDYKLFPIIQEHSSGKPILVFCPTRKGVMSTASQLADVCQKAIEAKQDLPWDIPENLNTQFSDSQLETFANLGLGVHHAGLSRDDRRAVEELFTKRKLNVIVATSTLAVGVNFPAHAVIIKGVMQWAGTGWAEYSAQDIMQMLGRAGRPQFDREGIAVIMCEKHLETKYSLLSTGGSHLESTLHHNLTEHINSEIGLGKHAPNPCLTSLRISNERKPGTISSVDTAKQWLRKTLLFRRIQKNPSHYNVGATLSNEATWEECMDALVTDSLRVLQETQLIRPGDGENDLILTDFGEIMSATMKTFIQVANTQEACLRSLLLAITGAEEFKDTLMRVGERQIYQKLSEHESIRFPIKKAETSSDKVSLLIQAVLGGVPLMSNDFRSLNSQPHMEALNVMRHAPRMIAALVDIALVAKNGAVIVNGTSLMRSINAKAWEDRPVVLKQFEGIGEKSFKTLAENGIATIQSLAKEDPGRIEILLNRRPPFGSELISAARALPRYSISIAETSTGINRTKNTLDITISVTISAKLTQSKANRFSKNLDIRGSSVLTVLSDNQYVDFRRISTKALLDSAQFLVTASLTKPSQTIAVIVAPVKLAGATERFDFKPSPPATAYPTLNTRPLKESEYPVDPDITDKDILDLTEFSKDTKPQSKKPAHIKGENTVSTKLRLPNGNYACREGLQKPPPSPKQPKTKKSAEPSALSSPTRSPQAQKATAAFGKQKSQLDRVHDKTSDGISGIKHGSLVRPRDPPPARGSTSRYIDHLLSSPSRLITSKTDDAASSSESDELPDPASISFNKKDPPADSPNSYGDSEMDLWAANIPSEILDVEDGSIFFPVSERPRLAEQTSSGPTTPPPRKEKKRPSNLIEEPELSEHTLKRARTAPTKLDEVIDLATPPHKQYAAETLPTPDSVLPPRETSTLQRKPLFQPSSSPPASTAPSTSVKKSEPSLATREPRRAQPTPDGQDDGIEEFLNSVFDGVKIVSGDKLNSVERPKNSVVIRLNSMPAENTKAVITEAKSSPAKPQKQTHEPKETRRDKPNSDDPMAELNAWLEENGL
ncbi:Sec63 [Ceratobasidium sp. 392]|nr:Sec63 [Ceratobasidium sp. 392]